MVGDRVFELSSGLKGYRIYHEMIVEIICVQMRDNNDFIFTAQDYVLRFQAGFF